MENVGSFALLLALALAAYSLGGSAIGAWTKRPILIKSSQRATIAVWALITIGIASLFYLLMTDQFRMSYVAAHSNRDLPLFYKATSLWSGQEGSLLLWSWILSTYAMLVVVLHRHPSPGVKPLMPWVNAVMMGSQCFFLWLNTIVASPFHLLLASGEGAVNMAVPDGKGLNPLLQHPAMVIHPPILYIGYVGFAVPFAFAAATLIVKPRGEEWIHVTRKWTMVTWLFLGTGILLGARWAYAVLGWGGYWGWDPVENASLMPWLMGTAFLHSVMMQEKKGMLKIWNMALIFSTYLLCLFGTSLTRTGMVSSVHAFARSPISPYFSGVLVVGVLFSAWLLWDSRAYLRSENQLESLVSRESSFLFNNLVLLAACFTVLWGTMFPVISEALTGNKISVGPAFFNKVNIPVGLFLLFLTGVGPLLAWRRSSMDGLRRNFLTPAVLGGVAGAALLILGVRSFFALMCLMLCVFVTATVVQEFYKGAAVIARKQGISLFQGVADLTMRNTRRYGGYVVHLGMVLIFIGLSGQAFTAELETELKPGQSATLKNYRFDLTDIKSEENSNYAGLTAIMDVYKDGEKIATMNPERRFYKASQQPVSVVNIRQRLNEDLYVVFLGPGQESQSAGLHVYINPLVAWIWIGGFVNIFGTLLALIPARGVHETPRRVAQFAAPQAVRA